MDEEKEVEQTEIKTCPFILDIPADAISLTVSCKLFVDGEIKTAVMELKSPGELHEGFIKGDEWETENCTWCVNTDLAKEFFGEES